MVLTHSRDEATQSVWAATQELATAVARGWECWSWHRPRMRAPSELGCWPGASQRMEGEHCQGVLIRDKDDSGQSSRDEAVPELIQPAVRHCRVFDVSCQHLPEEHLLRVSH